MCIIALQTKGAYLSDETIRTMFSGNPDGAGIMYAHNGRVHWQKGFFKVEQLIKAWRAIPEGCVAAMHCRIKTHGAVSSELCHPFALTDGRKMFKGSGDSACMLMHNGVMSFMEKDSHYNAKCDSDSSAYAKTLYDRFKSARLPNADELAKIRKETEASNRILLLDGNGDYVTAGEWEYKDGILYSNSHWKDWWGSYGYGSTGSSWKNSTWKNSTWKTSSSKSSSSYAKDYDDWDDDWNYYYGSSKLSSDLYEFDDLTEERDDIAYAEGLDRSDYYGDVIDMDGNIVKMVDDSYIYTDVEGDVYAFNSKNELVQRNDLLLVEYTK